MNGLYSLFLRVYRNVKQSVQRVNSVSFHNSLVHNLTSTGQVLNIHPPLANRAGNFHVSIVVYTIHSYNKEHTPK